MNKIRYKSIVLFLLITLLGVPQFVSCMAGEGDDLLNVLCSPEYEGRRVGTEGNRLAAQLLAEKMKSYALTPLDVSSDFLIPFDQGIAVICETMLAATMEDGSREELVYGKDYMFVGAVSTINSIFPVSHQVEQANPKAVLFIDPQANESLPPGDTFATMVLPTDELHFNSLGIGENGAPSNAVARLPLISMLRPVYDRISEATTLDIRYDFEKTVATLYNVVGVLPGKDRTKAVILSAHFDGAGDQAGNRLPCALDNASGVSVVDLVLSQIVGTEPPYDVIVAFTNAEESGLSGAYDLAGRLASQYESLYNINVDCVGIAGLPFLMQSPGGNSEALYAIMEAYLSRNSFINTPEGYGSSDHIAFEQAGIPAVVLGTPSQDVIHTANDTVERIDLGVIRGVAKMIVDFIAENPDIHTRMAENHVDDALADVPSLAYNEAVLQDDTLYMGSSRWMTYTEALRYHPSFPLPQVYKGFPVELCMVELSTFDMPDSAPGKVITMPDSPQNIMGISALYSDGITSYKFQFNAGNVRDSYVRQKIGEEGFLLTTRENNDDVIEGIGLQQGDMSLYLFDGDASVLLEMGTGISAHLVEYGTSKVTEENASTLLADPELKGLFKALAGFVKP